MEYKINEEIVSKSVNNEEVLLHLSKGMYFGLDGTGAFIYRNMKKGLGVSVIATLLADEYDVTEAVAKTEIEELARTLKKESILL
jgi:hypothetical protein